MSLGQHFLPHICLMHNERGNGGQEPFCFARKIMINLIRPRYPKWLESNQHQPSLLMSANVGQIVGKSSNSLAGLNLEFLTQSVPIAGLLVRWVVALVRRKGTIGWVCQTKVNRHVTGKTSPVNQVKRSERKNWAITYNLRGKNCNQIREYKSC